MASAWAQRAMEIERQPMPRDLSRVVTIICNDCEVRSEGMPWHFLGVQCPACQSFNTVVDGGSQNNNQQNPIGRQQQPPSSSSDGSASSNEPMETS
eukprot:CAMPEP_0204625464 /NCGR_PEP_ID=MMETSP0717-20131115/11222_1 /ASSEMBLY_ACC=CAM_ASM_000666 /TAXON_ID=230516 /ORGANISM="Chaetoceros curvisetus" /LENGTH=95 /DNA_ID=CAMNT_0051641171 /DNA_START=766 /DNA_END=1053 /DNA_ORIENTATION=+